MHPVRPCRAAWLLGAWLAWTTAWVSAQTDAKPAARDVPPAATASDDAELALQRALDLERQHKWSAAIEVYEEALHQWPARTDFRHRLRLCEIHSKLVRRYQDKSFNAVLLKLPRDKALGLYDELLDRIATHYVEPVAMEPLLRRGFDNLEVALRDPTFLQANAPGAETARVLWLRDAYRKQRSVVKARDHAEARHQVASACDLAQKALGVNPAAVALEFTFGACDALDDYSSYLTPDKLDDLYAMIDGNFVGLGVELKLDDQGLVLVGVIRGGPAFDAGLRIGDKITRVNGRTVQGLGLDEAAGKLQGADRTSVAITVLHASGASQTLTLVRRPIEVQSVAQARIVDSASGVGYVQLTGFQKSSTDELRKAISNLDRQGMRYLVLDLRGNPGGLLNVSVEIAERFLDSGVVVSTRGRAPGQTSTYQAHAAAIWRMPMSVLIDHDSASASEILAGALKDHRRATVLGERSYGKGSVQSIFPLRSAPAGLKLTTAKFYSPQNRPYSEQGVSPDVPVAVRLTAKPADPDAPPPSIDFGDPARDPVLSEAIRQARHQASKAG